MVAGVPFFTSRRHATTPKLAAGPGSCARTTNPMKANHHGAAGPARSLASHNSGPRETTGAVRTSRATTTGPRRPIFTDHHDLTVNESTVTSSTTTTSPIAPRQLLSARAGGSVNLEDSEHDDEEEKIEEGEPDEHDDGDVEKEGDPTASRAGAAPRLSLADTHAYRPSLSPHMLEPGGNRGYPPGPLSHGGSGFVTAAAATQAELSPPRGDPRRLWAVKDTQLRPRPSTLPPLLGSHPLKTATSCVASLATPSVVAVRISEALRRWPAAAEYDDEGCVATAWTSDRCCLTIYLWRGSGGGVVAGCGASSSSTPGGGDVLVECSKLRGSAVTFGHLCQAVLSASRGMGTGDDLRRAHQTSPLEMGERWELRQQRALWEEGKDSGSLLLPRSGSVTMTDIAQDLELVDRLIQTDRWDTQRLGLERLVALVDVFSSGVNTAVAVSRSIVMKPINYRFLWNLIVDKVLAEDDSSETASSRSALLLGGGDDDLRGAQRSIALRILANALTVLDLYDRKKTMETYALSASVPELIPALLDDLATGPGRPPSVTGLLSGPHEATYAIRCLRHLGVTQDWDKEQALCDLQKARDIGRAIHAVLEREAHNCYLKLTEDDRSC